jgi:iron complex outermembrane recepter protein
MTRSLRAEIAALLACTAATTLAFAPAALAQEDESDITVAGEVLEDEEQATLRSIDTITVTGSRIRQNEYTSTSPITVITAERTQLAGLLTTADILQKSTIASGQQVNDSFSGFVTDGGAGANAISLRGLGAQRTLVLVNGKRWSPSGIQGRTNNVDLSAIPSSIIGRIEILKDGASSIYGADAVAGVINVITRESLDGVQLSGQAVGTQDGGGARYTFDASWGKVGDRGSISLSAQIAKQESLQSADRGWAECGRSPRLTDQDGDGVIDNTDPFTGEPLCFGFIYGLSASALGFVRYEPSLAVQDPSNPFFDPFVAQFGIPFYTRRPESGLLKTTGTRAGSPLFDNEGPYYNDTLSASVTNIQSPNELISLTSFGNRDVDIGGSQANIYYEAFYNQRKTTASGGYRQIFPFISGRGADGNLHPYNPFASLEAFGPGLGGVQPVMPSYNLLDPRIEVDLERWNVFAGIDGDFGGSGWYYDAYVGAGRSSGTYRQQQLLNDRVNAAGNSILVDPVTGAVRCSDAALAALPGCVPANYFTEDALLRGILPDDVLAFIRKDTAGKTVYDGWQVSGFVGGELFSMPAGPVNVVIGAEFRGESVDDVPDPDAQISNFWGFATSGITKGRDNVTEVFGEIEVPLLSGRRFAEEVTLTAAARLTDYKSYGSDTTYKLGLAWAMTPQVLLRSTFGTSFRPPALYEQFLADSTGFVTNLSDPCNNLAATNLQPGDNIYDNCVAEIAALNIPGLDDPTEFRATSSILAITGGASDLVAETSDAFTIGLALTPDWSDFSVAIDFFNIKVENTVASPSVGFILGDCYGSANRSSAFCSRVGGRDAQGQLISVNSSFINIGVQETRGFDLNAVYEKQLPAGRLTIDATSTYIDKQFQQLFTTQTSLEGRWGYPRWSTQTQARYDYRDWRFGWTVSHIGKAKEARQFDPGTVNQNRNNRTPNHFLHTVSTRYTAGNWQAILTIRNVFDKDPPTVASGTGNQGANRFLNTLPGVGYDLFGRTYIMQLTRQF